jgi:Transmembrane family 220, helix
MSRVLAGLMALLFFFSCYLQLNDPDPERWIAMYGAAGIVCALHAFGRGPAWLAGLVTAVALAWAAVWAPRVIGVHHLFRDMFAEWHMTSGNVKAEEGRELGGLLIIIVTCGAVALARRRALTR